MTQLKTLNLAANRISEMDAGALSTFGELEELYLPMNALRCVPDVSANKKLTVLDLCNNLVDQVLAIYICVDSLSNQLHV